MYDFSSRILVYQCAMNHAPSQNGNGWEPEARLAVRFVSFKDIESQAPCFSDASSPLRGGNGSGRPSSSPTTHRKSMTTMLDDSKTATANGVPSSRCTPDPEVPRASLELE